MVAIVWAVAFGVAVFVKHRADNPVTTDLIVVQTVGDRWDATPVLLLVLMVALGLTAVIAMWAAERRR